MNISKEVLLLPECLKALSPIIVTVFGIVTFDKPCTSLKPSEAISVTVYTVLFLDICEGITKSPVGFSPSLFPIF